MTACYQLSGAGNDFIALVEPAAAPDPAEVRAWCRRGISIGADGVFTLERTDDGARMVHWNADGSRGELCLNGSRCAARLVFHLGWYEERLALHTDAGTLAARRIDATRVAIELPPIVGRPERRTLTIAGDPDPAACVEGWYLRVGVPHVVVPWPESLTAAPVARLGPWLRAHPDLGADGANVSWVRFVPPDRLELRTFERGVEAETLACGTAVVAAAAVGLRHRGLEPPVRAHTAGGHVLEVEVELGAADGDGLASVTLAGDARILARSELLPGALG